MKTIFNSEVKKGDAVINPWDVVNPVTGFPKVCISTFSQKIIDKFAALEGTEEIAKLISANGEKPVYRIHYQDCAFAFYLATPGAPASVCELEEVIAMGAEKFIFFGSCGILDDQQVEGRIIVPTAAVRDEGTSYHYLAAGSEIYPNEQTTAIFCETLDACGYPYVQGKTWTTDAIYRETREMVNQRKEEGCLAVEMEYAALAAVAQFRGVALTQFLYGADCLENTKWEPRDLNDHGLSQSEKYMTLAFECGLRLTTA